MGNRAIITTKERGIGVYLHWNGGFPSVEAFLEYCRLKHFVTPAADAPYALARLTQVVANFFGGTQTVGIVACADCASMAPDLENGVYIIEDWRVSERLLPFEGFEDAPSDELARRVHAIDAMQPAGEQLGSIIDAPEVVPGELGIGERVWVFTDYRQLNGRYQGGYVQAEVLGFGDDSLESSPTGFGNIGGVPFVGLFPDDEGECRGNINNYLREPIYRRVV